MKNLIVILQKNDQTIIETILKHTYYENLLILSRDSRRPEVKAIHINVSGKPLADHTNRAFKYARENEYNFVTFINSDYMIKDVDKMNDILENSKDEIAFKFLKYNVADFGKSVLSDTISNHAPRIFNTKFDIKFVSDSDKISSIPFYKGKKLCDRKIPTILVPLYCFNFCRNNDFLIKKYSSPEFNDGIRLTEDQTQAIINDTFENRSYLPDKLLDKEDYYTIMRIDYKV